jgi:hypothetical protein
MECKRLSPCLAKNYSQLRGDPLARLGGAEDGFNYGHVSDRVFKGDWHLSAFADSLGECLALQGVLIARWESFCRNPAAS